MAGGGGERLWPLSVASRPKPFINVLGTGTLLRKTWERAVELADPSHIYVVVPAALAPLVREELPETRSEQLIVEPFGKNTGPCVALAASYLSKRYENPLLVILPADHHIPDSAGFLEAVGRILRPAAAGYIAMIGLRPVRPETGFGYIERGSELSDFTGIYLVERFIEKPELALVQTMVQEPERFLWNAGVYVALAAVLLEAFRQHLPLVGDRLEALGEAVAASNLHSLVELYTQFPSVSLDHGVIEKAASNLAVGPSEFAWDDVGSWEALERLLGKDVDNANLVVGPATVLDAKGTVVHTDTPNTLVIGTRDVLIVRSEDRLLVCSKAHVEKIRAGVERLRSGSAGTGALSASPEVVRNSERRIVPKPWGSEICWADTPHYMAKILEVRAGHKLSLQYHNQKHETLMVQSGEGTMTLGMQKFPLEPGRVVVVPPRTIHRVEARTDLTILEVSTSHPADVVRLEDSYGRVLEP